MNEKNIACTATIQLNRLGDFLVKDVMEMLKAARATFNFDTSCNQLCWDTLHALLSVHEVELSKDTDWFQFEQKEQP